MLSVDRRPAAIMPVDQDDTPKDSLAEQLARIGEELVAKMNEPGVAEAMQMSFIWRR